MLAFICYFFPAVMAIWLYEALAKKKLCLKQCIFRFCTNTALINFLCLGIKCYILHTGSIPMFSQPDMAPQVAVNYLIMAIPVAIALVVVEVLLFKKVKVTVEEENEKSN